MTLSFTTHLKLKSVTFEHERCHTFIVFIVFVGAPQNVEERVAESSLQRDCDKLQRREMWEENLITVSKSSSAARTAILANTTKTPFSHCPLPVSSCNHNFPIFLQIYDIFSHLLFLFFITTCLWRCTACRIAEIHETWRIA